MYSTLYYKVYMISGDSKSPKDRKRGKKHESAQIHSSASPADTALFFVMWCSDRHFHIDHLQKSQSGMPSSVESFFFSTFTALFVRTSLISIRKCTTNTLTSPLPRYMMIQAQGHETAWMLFSWVWRAQSLPQVRNHKVIVQSNPCVAILKTTLSIGGIWFSLSWIIQNTYKTQNIENYLYLKDWKIS